MRKAPIVFSLFGQDKLAYKIQKKCHYEMGEIILHQFPDEETAVIINSDIKDRIVFFVTNLVKPNSKALPLIFAAETARSLGAEQIILIAPYLTYMRRDKTFKSGQGTTSQYFAKLISTYFDQLITIAPHLHRWHSLSSIYGIPTHALQATDSIATWIRTHISNPVLIGSGPESLQWITTIAEKALSPFTILEKIKITATHVETSIPGIDMIHNATPVLLDDIISTGITIMETVKKLQLLEVAPPVCIGVHAVFAENAYQKILDLGAAKIVSCNTIPHVSNGIDISKDIINYLKSTSEFKEGDTI